MSLTDAVSVSHRLHLGLLVNPWAGIGGAVALKGSDGAEVREEALRRGAEQRAPQRVRAALDVLLPYRDRLVFHTVAGDMGADLLAELGFQFDVVHTPVSRPTTAEDTEAAARAIRARAPGLILFAGGDGTARNLYAALGEDVPVLGIPAGVKIHSAVYAVSPVAAGRIVAGLLDGKALELTQANVMDIDETAFRDGVVRARLFGYMRVPADPLVQQSKASARAVESDVSQDIAEQFLADMTPDTLYLLGSGSTCMSIKQALGIEGTLLGVDAVRNGELLAKDCTEQQLFALAGEHAEVRIVVTVIGGQGHVFGRGNQQLSPRLLRRVGRERIVVVASPGKLQSLNGRPLLIDSGDPALDAEFAGPLRVVTGYGSEAMYSLA